MRTLRIIFFLSVLPIMMASAWAYKIPENDSRAKYFYVFGPEGDKYLGAEASGKLEFYFDVPADASDLTVELYDPQTGGSMDFRVNRGKKWDTTTECTLKGGAGRVLDTHTFADDPEFDRRYYKFGPFEKTLGEPVNDAYRFTLTIRATAGSDANLFNIRVSPKNVESFSYLVTWRLLPGQGEVMTFYPQVSADTDEIIVENYDLDPAGGSAALIDPATGIRTPLPTSESGTWATAIVPLIKGDARRLHYSITKKTQKYAHAGIRVKDAAGKPLPIYFKQGIPIPVTAPLTPSSDCTQSRIFTFDASRSSDPGNLPLTYTWDFGDGTSDSGIKTTHQYEKGGEYTVTLKVKNTSGLACNNASTTQVVKVNIPPVARFSAASDACVDCAVVFDAQKTSHDTPETLSYLWDFGDGTTGEGKQVEKTFNRPGEFRVTLAVDDKTGIPCSISRAEKTIKVHAPVRIHVPSQPVEMCFSPDDIARVYFNFVKAQEDAGMPLSYSWDFGDGSTSKETNAAHTYAAPGTYRVSLTVDNGMHTPCSKDSREFTLVLRQSPVAHAGNDQSACVNELVTFNGADSKGEPGRTLEYRWDFGDGTPVAQGMRQTHRFERAGAYGVTLSLRDSAQDTCANSKSIDTLMVHVNTPPSVSLRGPSQGCLGATVSFDASESRDPDGDQLTYAWDFGDGLTAQGPSVMEHTYTSAGTFNVRVTADDQQGMKCSTASAARPIRINTPCQARATVEKACCAGMESLFDASGSSDADNDPLTYSWDFGDGTEAQGAKATHSFARGSTYLVTLRVNDGRGSDCSESTETFSITVNEKPQAVMEIL